MGKRNIGRMAENRLRLWASEQAISCNGADNDELGWDFHLQFRNQNQLRLADTLDLRPPELSCVVQVKGVGKKDANRRRLSLKLSNWESLVKNPLPAFYLVLVFGEAEEPAEAYVVHVDREWIARVLKRLRGLHAKDLKRLHKKTLDLKWEDQHRLPAAAASAFRAAVENSVGPDPAKYFKQKALDVANVGCGPDRIRGRFTLSAPDPQAHWSRLVDFAIGLRPTLPVEIFSAEEVRFEIAKPLHGEGVKLGGAQLRRESVTPTEQATLIVRTKDGAETIVYSFGVFVPQAVFPFIPPEFTRLRFVAPYLEIILSASLKTSFKIDMPSLDDSFDLNALAHALELPELLHRATPTGVALDLSIDGKKVSAVLETKDLRNPDVGFSRPASLIRRAWKAAIHAGLVSAKTSVRELLEQDTRIEMTRALQRGVTARLFFDFTVDSVEPLSGRLTTLIPSIVTLGSSAIVTVGRLTGAVAPGSSDGSSDSGWHISSDEVELVQQAVVPVDAVDRLEIEQRIATLEHQLADRGHKVVPFDPEP